ncbi:hypothetical protein [Vallitalea guaymasensis]|uniref:Uncharacterized protein n=1 Tax=Vallitalea guaymasensis TaxID=1185412 RepID=A0A8J8M998_9FIRM|nr:hypothetical protein [Vallitalea guaymasensis]QUH28679.1 hypothetical protein HYG85_07025 [Vallitalea guaymasensis]
MVENSNIQVGSLGNWIKSWVQESGAIYGFHNHSVWGSNPYRLQDFTSGHSTFASPFLAGLSYALSKKMNDEGKALLDRLIQYQATSFQENNQYKHVGFQVGETLQSGLIHNAVANISLGLTAFNGKSYLSEEKLELIKKAILKNLLGTYGWGGGRPSQDSCCNQDYARIWSKLIFQKTFNDKRYEKEIPEDIDFMIKNFHRTGFPDEESVATYRNICFEQNDVVEPAEYYGLMICPLIEAYEQYGEKRFLDQAIAICNQIIRSSWVDDNGKRRFHKMWFKVNGEWAKLDDPMLIAGMGMNLLGMKKCLQYHDSKDLRDFINECKETYSFYQTKRGYFVSATGWKAEADIAPCTAWHAHDFMYLVEELDSIDDSFWMEFNQSYNKTSALLGDNCIWIEDNTHWAIKDYYSNGLYTVLGRKDSNKFGVDMGWIPGNRSLDNKYTFTDAPVFVKTSKEILVINDSERELDIDSIINLPIRGK